MSGPVETELPPSSFSRRAVERRGELRLTLSMNNRSSLSDPADLKSQVRTMEIHELARKISQCNNKHRLPFILLDCRGYLCYTDCHIRGAVHIACTDRFNRKRVQNAGSVLDLVSTNNRRNKTHNNAIYHNSVNGKYRDVIVYDEGTSRTDLNLDATWTNPVSFVLAHLLQENRQPIYLNGGMKEFLRFHRDLCDSTNRKDLSMSSTASSPTSPFLPSPLCQPLSPSASTYNIPSTPHCNESYENEPPTQVLPFLYVGNARDAADTELLKRLNIGYVLSVTMSMPYSHSNSYNNLSKCAGNSNVNNSSDSSSINDGHPGLRTKLIPVSDNLCENLAPYFDEACDFIEEARRSGRSILIHCQAGISRSPTIAIAYIMKYIKLSTLEAYALVQRSRRIISPNLNFMGQLVEWEKNIKGLASQQRDVSAKEAVVSSPTTSNSPTSHYSSSELEPPSSSSSTTSSLSPGIPSPPIDPNHHRTHPLLNINGDTVTTNSNFLSSPSASSSSSSDNPMIIAD